MRLDGIIWSEPLVAFQVASDTSAWDHTHAETPAVIKNPISGAPTNQKFMMWYSGANKILAAGQQPSVLFNPASLQYEMWLSNDTDTEKGTIPCNFNTVNGFWYAVSDDGINWTPDYSKRNFEYSTSYMYEELGFLTGIEVLLVNGEYSAYYTAWGTEQIPNDTVYLCPDQQGGFMPAVLTLNRATAIQP